MGQNLFYHLVFVDEADDFHQTVAVLAKQWGNPPDFLYAFPSHQRKLLFCPKITYENYLALSIKAHFIILDCRFSSLFLSPRIRFEYQPMYLTI